MSAWATKLFVVRIPLSLGTATLLFLMIGCTGTNGSRFRVVERTTNKIHEGGFSVSVFGIDNLDQTKSKQFLYQLIHIYEDKTIKVEENLVDGPILTVETRDFSRGKSVLHTQFSWSRVQDDVGKYSIDGESIVPRKENNLFVFRIGKTAVDYEFWGYSGSELSVSAINNKLGRL